VGQIQDSGVVDKADPSGRNPGDVWTLPARGILNSIAIEVPLRCIAAGCRPGGTVLDMFAGIATTGLAAGTSAGLSSASKHAPPSAILPRRACHKTVTRDERARQNWQFRHKQPVRPYALGPESMPELSRVVATGGGGDGTRVDPR
jgi:hypothetical protein